MNHSKVLGDLAYALGQTSDDAQQWAAIASAMEQMVGYGLLTGLVYLKEQKLMRRIYSSNEDVSPLGGFKATGKGPWSTRVLDQGLSYIGRDEADIRTVFSEAEDLIARGLHSVLNIPIGYQGAVVGSINMLSSKGAYNGVSDEIIRLIAGVCLPVFASAQQAAIDAARGIDVAQLQSV